MDRNIYQESWQLPLPVLRELIPFKYYDRLPKLYEHAAPFVIANYDKTRQAIAWHSQFRIIYPHTSSYRMMRAIAQDDVREVERVIEQWGRQNVSIDTVIDKKYQMNALQLAATLNRYAIAELLLLNGANIDQQGKYGFSPLMLAAQAQNKEAVHTLTKNGCSLDLKDKYGYTVIDQVKNSGNGVLYDFLTKMKEKSGKRIFPVFTVRLNFQKKLKNSALEQWKKHRIYQQKVIVSPFNNLKGIYHTTFTSYQTVQDILKQN